jgi:GT2 family glycosyltransferase
MRLSVIIPVHNAAATLQRCLAALWQSEFRDFECLVVDDGCTDDTSSVARGWPVTVITLERRGGPARARNHGAARARGEILVFLDGDVCVHGDTLERLQKHLRQHKQSAAVFGSYDDTPTDPHFVSQYKNLLHHYVHQRSHRDAWTFWAGCGAIRREVFLHMGGFDESYTRPCVEDIELGLRLRAGGQRIDLDPAIQVTHLKGWRLSSLLRADLFDRAIPWLLLMLRYRVVRHDLNVTVRDRASVALVWIMALSGTAMLSMRAASPPLITALVACVAGLCILNVDLYRFFARQRGVMFAVRVLPLHWLYFWYCGLAVPMALGLRTWRVTTAHKPVVAQDA